MIPFGLKQRLRTFSGVTGVPMRSVLIFALEGVLGRDWGEDGDVVPGLSELREL